jgi:hypothetical protein
MNPLYGAEHPHCGSLIRESGLLAHVGLCLFESASHSAAMPKQNRLNLYATLFAALAFVILAFSQSGGA